MEGMAFQQLLNLFFQEEFIRRLAQSKYREQLILKGGFLLYAISDFKTRPTLDADYLLKTLKNHSNEPDSVEFLVRSILHEKTSNEFMIIELLGVERISEMREYHGIRVSLLGLMGNSRTPFSIDFGVGDTIVPSAVARTLPVLLEELSIPTILTYSLESTISDKQRKSLRSLFKTSGISYWRRHPDLNWR